MSLKQLINKPFAFSTLIALGIFLSPVASFAADSLETGISLYYKDQYKEAVPFLEKAAQDHPLDANTHYMLASSLYMTKDVARAKTEYIKCIQVSPSGKTAASAKAMLDYLQGRTQQVAVRPNNTASRNVTLSPPSFWTSADDKRQEERREYLGISVDRR